VIAVSTRFRLAFALVVGIMGWCAAGRLSAAELKVEYAELAGIVRVFTQDAKLHVHNAPAKGLIEVFSAQSSYFSLAGHQVSLDVPTVEGWAPLVGNYSYYVNDLNLSGLTVSAISGAVRIVMLFDSSGYRIVPSDERLPSIQWSGAAVVLDLRPVKAGNSISLEAVNVEVKGTLKPICLKPGFFCTVALEQARPKVRKLPGQLSAQLKSVINGDKLRDGLAKSLESYLTLGSLGQVKIRSVKNAGSTATISFCLQGC
jgi:hypothetical protein